jgi:Ser/Thr protein kinase RdoA (MazF antagonist)
VRETTPGRDFVILLEDPTPGWRRATRDRDLLVAAEALGRMRDGLARLLESCPELFVDHERLTGAAFLAYVRPSLESFAVSHGAGQIGSFLRNWAALSESYLEALERKPRPMVPVHGDYGPSNLLVRGEAPGDLRVLDWEWAGRGPLHTDLAILLKGQDEAVEQAVLRSVFARDPSLAPEEHLRLYLLARLERSLLDAAYLAAHLTENREATVFNVPAFIRGALDRAEASAARLRAA